MRSSFKYSLCLVFNLILTSLIFLSLDNDNLFLLGLLGVFHPLFVHLPIGLWFGFIIFLLIGTIKKSIHIFPFLKIISILVLISSVFSFLTGLALKLNGYTGDIINAHLYAAVIFIYFISFFCIYHFKERSFLNLWISSLIVTFCLGYTGHLGSTITHGTLGERISKNFSKKEKIELQNSSDGFFEISVYPILESKCVYCHNDRRSQGGLNMMTEESILKGGLFGSAISIGDSQSSEIIRRINLPVHDKFHMPPSEPYITNDEKEIIEWWINHSFSKNNS